MSSDGSSESVTTTVFTAVSFARVPLNKLGPLMQEILNRGWTWSRNDSDWVGHFRKDVPETTTAANDGEAEIASIMGDYYIDSDALRLRAEQWRSFMRDEGPLPDFAEAEKN